MKKILEIEGMKCDKCTSRIKSALENMDNIKSVDVSLENKEAIIEYDKDINLEIINETINDLGFKVKSIK